MKKINTFFCFALSLMLICTMTVIPSYANEDAGAENQAPAVEESTVDQQASVEESIDAQTYGGDSLEDVTVEAMSEEAAAPAPVSNIKVYPGYYKVKVTWKAVPGATGYKVERYENGRWKYKKTVNTNSWVNYRNVKMYKVYKYRITAMNGSLASAPRTIKGQCVRKMRIYIKTRSSRTLYSHDRKHKKARIKAGKKLMSDEYRGGAYYFKYKGARYRIMNVNASATKADYAKKNDYTPAQAEFFINDYVKKNKVAKKKYLLWVSSYHQRMYVFQKKGKMWSCIKNWNVSMGKKSSPSPTGNRKIQRKVRKRHGCPYWSTFSTWNSLHGVRENWDKFLGTVRSEGCIRNPDKGAKWIYYNCPKGTSVVIY